MDKKQYNFIRNFLVQEVIQGYTMFELNLASDSVSAGHAAS